MLFKVNIRGLTTMDGAFAVLQAPCKPLSVYLLEPQDYPTGRGAPATPQGTPRRDDQAKVPSLQMTTVAQLAADSSHDPSIHFSLCVLPLLSDAISAFTPAEELRYSQPCVHMSSASMCSTTCGQGTLQKGPA